LIQRILLIFGHKTLFLEFYPDWPDVSGHLSNTIVFNWIRNIVHISKWSTIVLLRNRSATLLYWQVEINRSVVIFFGFLFLTSLLCFFYGDKRWIFSKFFVDIHEAVFQTTIRNSWLTYFCFTLLNYHFVHWRLVYIVLLKRFITDRFDESRLISCLK